MRYLDWTFIQNAPSPRDGRRRGAHRDRSEPRREALDHGAGRIEVQEGWFAEGAGKDLLSRHYDVAQIGLDAPPGQGLDDLGGLVEQDHVAAGAGNEHAVVIAGHSAWLGADLSFDDLSVGQRDARQAASPPEHHVHATFGSVADPARLGARRQAELGHDLVGVHVGHGEAVDVGVGHHHEPVVGGDVEGAARGGRLVLEGDRSGHDHVEMGRSMS